MNWDDPVPVGFCERQWSTPGGFFYEPANALSSLAYLAVAWVGGTRGGGDTWSRLLYSCLFLCGIGSFFYHSFMIEVFRVLDEVSILLLVSLGSYVALDDADVLGGIQRSHEQKFWWSVSLLAVFFCALTLEIFFKEFFLFCLVSTVVALIIPSCAYLSRRRFRMREQKFLSRAIVTFTVALTAWSIDLIFCSQWISFVYLHSWWHVWSAIGVSYFIELHEAVSRQTSRSKNSLVKSWGPLVLHVAWDKTKNNSK